MIRYCIYRRGGGVDKLIIESWSRDKSRVLVDGWVCFSYFKKLFSFFIGIPGRIWVYVDILSFIFLNELEHGDFFHRWVVWWLEGDEFAIHMKVYELDARAGCRAIVSLLLETGFPFLEIGTSFFQGCERRRWNRYIIRGKDVISWHRWYFLEDREGRGFGMG